MLKTLCPYCQHPEMPLPPKQSRPFATCPACGRRSRAAIDYIGNVRQVRYVATAPPRQFVRDTFSITPEQQAWLRAHGNKSEALRMALDDAMKKAPD